MEWGSWGLSSTLCDGFFLGRETFADAGGPVRLSTNAIHTPFTNRSIKASTIAGMQVQTWGRVARKGGNRPLIPGTRQWLTVGAPPPDQYESH